MTKNGQHNAADAAGLGAVDWAHLARQVALGAVVGYPTETVWGLAAAPEHVQKLQRLKGRDAHKPLQVSCADVPTALSLAAPHPLLEVLVAFWPGPLTVIAPAAPRCPAPLAPGGQVGLRLPDHPVAQRLLSACGPLATSSLNPAAQSPALSYEQAAAYALADLLLGGAQDTAGGLASTVMRLGDPADRRVQVLREGALPLAALRAVLDPLGMELHHV